MSVSARQAAADRPAADSCQPADSIISLAQGLADDLARRWAQGERPRTEEYLAHHPQLAERPDAALELIYEEMCQQLHAGDDPRASAWLLRFPRWQPQIEKLLACRDLLEQGGGDTWFPEPGETFGEFQLLDVLGHGAHGRVYLARQPSLADRPVVLKLASLGGQEHLSLARLQHTYIMPLYWAQDDTSLGLRTLCMPYIGGVPLSHLLTRLAGIPPGRRTGGDLLAALTDACGEQRLTPPVQGPACRFMAKASYVEAMCALGACLAEALDYAHERDVVHHDLKPSNVLVAADGQPLLLDFHLAQRALEPGAEQVAWLGGTPGYMAPEHQAALAAVLDRRPIPQRVDGKADLFSLGVLLCEGLAGDLPPTDESPARWLRRANPQVSPALADVLSKCLAPEASHRYPSAGALAADLRRHLAHRPLKHVANRSLVERWHKWRRRRPYALMSTFLTVALLTACAVIASTVHERWQSAERALSDAQEEMRAGRFQGAKMSLDHGLSLAATLPWRGQLWQDLRDASVVADSGHRLQLLHALVVQLRALYGPEGLPAQDAERLEAETRRLWGERHLFFRDGVDPLPGNRSREKDDLVDLALFWAAVQERRADQAGSRAVAQDRLAILQEAERMVGARLILCREQQRLATLLGDDTLAAAVAEKARALVPASGWEHYALGRSDLTAGRLGEADAHFRAAVTMNPKDLWPNFYHARVAYQLEQYEEALTAFTVCVVLADRAPWSYYNRGLANVQLGRSEAARDDFDRALDLNPNLSAAALERGLLSYGQHRYDEAIADLKRASSDPAQSAGAAYGLAVTYAAKGDRVAARRQLDVLFAHDPDHEDGRKLADVLEREEP
ncbi:MAG TPA: serine/threonine-protein kinase [Pirellulales bacterium]|nr:serine/threonine-protein kinase [Pirellulales bacterium]